MPLGATVKHQTSLSFSPQNIFQQVYKANTKVILVCRCCDRPWDQTAIETNWISLTDRTLLV